MPNKDLLPNPEGLISFAAHRAAMSMEMHYSKNLKKNNIDINLHQWGIIYRLLKSGGLEKSELSSQLFAPIERMAPLVDDLEEKNFIVKKDNLLHLTELGQKLIGEVMPIMFESVTVFIKDIPPEHMIIAVNVLNRIVSNINPDKELYQLNTPPKYIEVDN